jgi:hypothetical protein
MTRGDASIPLAGILAEPGSRRRPEGPPEEGQSLNLRAIPDWLSAGKAVCWLNKGFPGGDSFQPDMDLCRIWQTEFAVFGKLASAATLPPTMDCVPIFPASSRLRLPLLFSMAWPPSCSPDNPDVSNFLLGSWAFSTPAAEGPRSAWAAPSQDTGRLDQRVGNAVAAGSLVLSGSVGSRGCNVLPTLVRPGECPAAFLVGL